MVEGDDPAATRLLPGTQRPRAKCGRATRSPEKNIGIQAYFRHVRSKAVKDDMSNVLDDLLQEHWQRSADNPVQQQPITLNSVLAWKSAACRQVARCACHGL